MEDHVVNIDPEEILEDRPFTHPGHTEEDRPVLDYMLEKLRHFMQARQQDSLLREAEILPETDGRSHRYFIPRPPVFMVAENLAVVGFFGQKRPGAHPDHFGTIGSRLMVEIPSYVEIVSYSTMELPNGNFANLVLLNGESVKEAWRLGQTHSRAVERSPSYYSSVRIYNGELEYASSPTHKIRLTHVKYWDYEHQPTWRGIRSLV